MAQHQWSKRPSVRLAAAVALAVSLGGISPARASTADPVQQELDAVMVLQPGGVQVSDNAVVWGDADVVYVVPSKGELLAPIGLGKNLRKAKLNTPALKGLASLGTQSSASKTSTATTAATASASSCPHGIGVKDYYCFYQYRDFGGRRVQFTGATSVGNAADWGFDNTTSSWVSWDVDCKVTAFYLVNQGIIWYEPENSQSSYVGSANDNRLSSWWCD